MKLRSFILTSFVIVGLCGYAQDKAPVAIAVEGYVASRTSGSEELVKLDQIEPGQDVEFIVTCKNVSKHEVKSWRVTMPVPEQTTLVSEKTSKRYQAPVRMSTDGGDSYSKENQPIIAGATHLQWRLSGLKPGKSVVLRYRVKTK